MREKRLRRVVSYIPSSLYEQLELFKEEESKILSMSDYLHEVIERHLHSVSKQKFGRRAVNS